MIDNQTIGRQIASLRQHKKITQAELGTRLGVTFQAVSKWERGENLPEVTLLPLLADTLETTVDHILRGGETRAAFRGKLSVGDVMDGLNHLKEMGDCLGRDCSLYRLAIQGINQSMNTDVEAAFTNRRIFEAFAAEVLLQGIQAGMYVDPTEIQRSFTCDHFRDILLEQAKKYHIT